MASTRTLWLAAFLAASVAVALAVLLTQRGGPGSAKAADHLDAPGLTPPGGSVQTDITDIFAFRSPTNPQNTVLALNVNGVASPSEVAPGPNRTFADKIPLVGHDERVTYNLNIDNNGDAVTDARIAVRFGKPHADGSQKLQVKIIGAGGDEEGDGLLNLEGWSTPFGAAPVINQKDGITAFAGRRDDPFFFDLPGFLNILGPGSLIGCGSADSHPERDFFARRNVSSIVIELPSSRLTSGSSKIGVWGSTNVPDLQLDRMGRPAIATVFIPNNPLPPDRVSDGKSSLKNTYNHSDPVNDQANFRGEIIDTLVSGFGRSTADADALANFLLPDILTFDTASSAGFPNGRRLDDDVIDTELNLLSDGSIPTDCVPSDNTLLGTFPYLGNPN
jgi:hypothetical protein